MAAGLLKLGPCVLSFPRLVEPHAFKPDQKATYHCNLIFKGGKGAEVLQKEIDRVAKEKWGEKIPKKFLTPLKTGDEMGDYEGYDEDDLYCMVKKDPRYGAPQFVGPDNKVIDPSALYAGCLVIAAVRVFAYDQVNVGVSISLEAMQKVADGDSLGGFAPVDVNEVFEAVSEDDLSSFLG